MEDKNRKFKPVGLVYTKGQDTALNMMIDWVNSKSNFFTIYGPAGVGKTTVIKDFIKHCGINNSSIAVTAPTHKAVRIVSNSVNLTGVTIQKLLGLRPNINLEDFDINNPVFDKQANAKLPYFRLLIIDESSMINDDLYNLIHKEALQFNVKVLFVGDKYQLPPVKSRDISKVFTNVKEKYEITEIVRQGEDNPLISLLEIARNDVKYNTFKLIEFLSRHPIKFNDKQKGYALANKLDFQKFMTNTFNSDEFTKDINYAKFAAFTNENVLAWNEYLRSVMFKDNAKHPIILDDLITAYSTVLDEFLSPIIVNSEDYIIDDIQDYTNQSGIKGFIVRFRKVYGGQLTPNMFIVDSNDEDNNKKFLGIHHKYVSEAKLAPRNKKAKAWESYYSFKESHLLIKSFYDEQGRIIVKKDMDYGYCLTVHKTQGSTYNNIFVNAKNIIYNKYGRPYADQTLRNKLLYVALSRAKDTAIIFI